MSDAAGPAPVARQAARTPRTPRAVRAHCELDDWWFDPRYTDGRCPICGWQAPGAATAPMWLAAARKFEWELTGLAALLVVLVVVGVLVAAAAGYRLPIFASHHPAVGVTRAASSARSASSPSAKAPSHISPRPSQKKSP